MKNYKLSSPQEVVDVIIGEGLPGECYPIKGHGVKKIVDCPYVTIYANFNDCFTDIVGLSEEDYDMVINILEDKNYGYIVENC